MNTTAKITETVERIAEAVANRVRQELPKALDEHGFGKFHAKVVVHIRENEIKGFEPSAHYEPNFIVR